MEGFGISSAYNPTLVERLKLIIVNLIVTIIAFSLLKGLIDVPRHNQLEPNLYATYLPDFAYPSGHVSMSFSFVFPLLGHALFPFSYLIGLIVSYSVVSQGMNSWLDVGGAIAVAGLGYNIAESLVFKQKKVIYKEDERARQAVHACVGLSVCLMIWLLGIEETSHAVLIATCIGILIIHLILMGFKLPYVDKLLDKFERGGVLPGEGSLYYALGVLFTLGLLRGDSYAAISVIVILALGDAFATYIGTNFGNHKLPWNRSKTAEGSISFAATAMLALLILPTAATIWVVVLAAIVESLPMKLDDNITLPVVSSIFYYLIL